MVFATKESQTLSASKKKFLDEIYQSNGVKLKKKLKFFSVIVAII